MGYIKVQSTLGDSCSVSASGARVCMAAPAVAPVVSWGGGGQPWNSPATPWWANQASVSPTQQKWLKRHRKTSQYWDSGGVGPAMSPNPMLSGLGAIVQSAFTRNLVPARRTGWSTPVATPLNYWGGKPAPVVPSITSPTNPNVPDALANWWKTAGTQSGRNVFGNRSGRGGFNNVRGTAYGASNYAPWNTSPTCSDPTSQFYNPSDPSCATGNNPICTNPSVPGYNPSDPSCAAINAAANAAAGTSTAVTTTAAAAPTTDYSSWLLIGGAGLLLIMLLKK